MSTGNDVVRIWEGVLFVRGDDDHFGLQILATAHPTEEATLHTSKKSTIVNVPNARPIYDWYGLCQNMARHT